MRDWSEVLPAQSVCLVVPVVPPSEYDLPLTTRRREIERERLGGQPIWTAAEN
jgi:hypothetical protein